MTFTLAGLLAWPWNVVPSDLELAPEAVPAARESLHVPGKHWVQRGRQPSARDLSSDPAISPRCDEEEGDQGGPAPLVASLDIGPGRHVSIVIDLNSERHWPTALPGPRARRYRLRC